MLAKAAQPAPAAALLVGFAPLSQGKLTML